MALKNSTVKTLRASLYSARRGVVFTGAGISTESGIPDFRSPGGIWDKYRPIEFKDFMASAEMRRESWRRKFAADAIMQRAKPNIGHLAIAELVEKGHIASVITQNIDGLHQASGIPDHLVIELHGNATYAHCLDCKKRFTLAFVRRIFEKDETPPLCDICGGIIKTATISFGQAMPLEEMKAAEAATLACDLFFAIGSSLVVYPAAGFPALAKQKGAKLIILNRDPTPLDALADLVLHAEIGPTLQKVVSLE